ncbi:MAG: anti-sigma factor [Ginsengibacter sp.]
MESKDIISSGLLELYVLGLASNEENTNVRRWITQFPEVDKEIAEIQVAMEGYALAQATQPDQSVKKKILDRIVLPSNDKVTSEVSFQKNETAKVYTIPSYYKWAAAASIILLIGSLIINYTYYNKYQSVSANLQVAQNELNKQKEIAAGMSKDMQVVTDKNAMPVVLKGTPHAPDALAKIFWMQNTGEVYVDPTNLPQPAADKQYQLWAIVDGKPVDGGMISIQKGLYKIQKMKSFGKAEAFAITLEKQGGSPTPTMQEMYVIAKIKI